MTVAFVKLLLTAIYLTVALADEETLKAEHRAIRDSDRNTQTNGLYGVASVAGITSRNGRVSTQGGVRFFPAPDSSAIARQATNQFARMPYSGETFPSSVLGLYPDFSAPNPGFSGSSIASLQNSLASSFPFPSIGHPVSKMFYPNIQKMFEPITYQNIKPWFPKSMVRGNPSYNYNRENIKSSWMYPHFDPFYNYWR